MKMYLFFIAMFLVFGNKAPAQLAGKFARFGIENSFCGEEIYFLNDSLAVTMSGCEARQALAFYQYRLTNYNKLVFEYIPKEEINPIKALFKTDDINLNQGYFGSGDLMMKYVDDSLSAETVLWSFHWLLMNDSLRVSGGNDTENLSFANLSNSDLCVRILRLNQLFKREFCFHPSNFSEVGNVYIIDLIFPVHFFMYQLSYEEDSSFMDFSYKNGQLYYMYRGEYVLCELESIH